MFRLSLLFLVISGTTTYAQIGPDGTGTVNGYIIGPGADLTGAVLSNANLAFASLYGASLPDANLSGADLSGADLSSADLSGADLRFANLAFANLSGANLYGANLTFADLRFANLTGAYLSYTDLEYADLSGATLRFAVLTGADLSGADLSGNDVSGATWTDGNVFGGADYTITQAEYETALSDLAAAIAERDARPTQVAYDTVVAERDARPTQVAYDTVVAEREAKLTLDEVKDLRAGSTMIAVENGTATLSMEVVQSDDLEIWTSGGTTDLQIPVGANSDTKFFRFKMTE